MNLLAVTSGAVVPVGMLWRNSAQGEEIVNAIEYRLSHYSDICFPPDTEQLISINLEALS